MASIHSYSYSPRRRATLDIDKLVAFQHPFVICDDYGQLQDDIALYKKEKNITGLISREKVSVSGFQEIIDQKRLQTISRISIFSDETFCVVTSQSDLVKAVHKPELKNDIIPLSRFLVKNLDALIVLLMLVKHGTVAVNFLHSEISEESTLELVAELRKYDLVIISGSKITITEQGSDVIKKLHKKSA